MNKLYSYYRTLLLALTLPVSFFITSCGHQSTVAPQTQAKSLSQALDLYGYKKPEEKKALEYLLQQAGIIASEKTLSDRFPARSNQQEILGDILDLVQLTQTYLSLRSGNKERWEVTPSVWMEQSDKKTILEKLKTLQVINSVYPTIKNPDAICILGSTFKSIKERLAYVSKLLSEGIKTKQLILLVGERRASINVDGNEAELQAVAQEFGINDLSQLTETHLGKKAYQTSAIYNKLPIHVIDTPSGNLPRPTTETTIMELNTWLQGHSEIQTIVFISNQPHVRYQTAIITEVLTRLHTSITFDIVGSAINKDIQTHSLIEALGSYLWAKTPLIIEELGIQIEREDLKQSFKKLYEKNPVLLQHINQLCDETATTSVGNT